MNENSGKNKRIAKNTLMLYLRMFLIMGVGLYTSRVVLQTLGVSDFGIFNVVGGFVTMLAYLNAVFVDSTQRFISFSLGENDLSKLKRVFSTSFFAIGCLALLILLIAETFGLWFVNNKLVIPEDRLVAANWVYQCAVASLLVSIINIPFKASVVAHEKMHIYAYISIVEAVLKLLIVYALVFSQVDKLILYSILHFVVSLVIPLWFILYCRKHFQECVVTSKPDKTMFKEMFSFSGWVLVGNLGFTFKDQLSNVIMNLFLGTTINAARGVATQLNGVMMTFANNFLMALSPQITMSYATRDMKRNRQLVFSGMRLSFYLMAIVTIPIIINIGDILRIWLVEVPQYTEEFAIIILMSTVLFAMSKPLTIDLQATGDIKAFQIGVAVIMLSELPIAFFILKAGLPPYYALLPALVTNLVGVVYRFVLLQKKTKIFESSYFYLNVLLKSILLYVVILIVSNWTVLAVNKAFHSVVIDLAIPVLISCVLLFVIGLDRNERALIVSWSQKVVNSFLKKNRQ